MSVVFVQLLLVSGAGGGSHDAASSAERRVDLEVEEAERHERDKACDDQLGKVVVVKHIIFV